MGTHDGPWGSLESTGWAISIQHMFFFRSKKDQIIEVWELLDRSDLGRQLTGD
ncbi:MAG: ester cyclase [Acidimicrobiia bacterium]